MTRVNNKEFDLTDVAVEISRFVARSSQPTDFEALNRQYPSAQVLVLQSPWSGV